ncbi:class I SAM-dependent methyltransferase [Thermococcus stetteri]|uniref:class I SAM-dependent methyltransferase n=1 Tax=Thermococcus stetteri TaxID=49900 RepID=UPI001AE7A047|nr:ubiquinone/menaquinone biosynthesis C-methylase UbiE [Thermococcus stetteri]
MRYDITSYIYEPVNTLLEVPTGIRKARKELVKKAKGRVIELGVGTGLNLPLYPEGVEVVGIDVSEKMLEKAMKKRSKARVSLMKADARNLPFPDGSFDTAVSTFFLCVVPEKEKVIEEIRRVLKPDGFLLAMECSSPDNLIFRAFLNALSSITSRLTGTDFRINIRELLEKNGFSVVEERKLVNGAVRILTVLPEKEQERNSGKEPSGLQG